MRVIKNNPNRRRFKELEAGDTFIFEATYYIKISRLESKTSLLQDFYIPIDAVDIETGDTRELDGEALVTCLPHASFLPYGDTKS